MRTEQFVLLREADYTDLGAPKSMRFDGRRGLLLGHVFEGAVLVRPNATFCHRMTATTFRRAAWYFRAIVAGLGLS
jgi:hypothetical protein